MGFVLDATATDSRARAGRLTTLHGTVETPVFMPVGTRGSVRTQTLDRLERLDAPVMLANTYHLMVRPGPDVFHKFGGLHHWIRWKRAILTDSGGFQIFSLADGVTIDDAGARFKVQGTQHVLTPERSIEMQRAIGSDVMMVLDQCIASTSPPALARVAMDRTHAWAKRSLAARGDSPQKLFAIVQGACYPELRRASAAALTAIDGFDGYAIGGLAVGEPKHEREDVTELVTALLPQDRPRYLMGVGTPLDILEAVHRGVDMFDCILPTAWAQHGRAFTSRGRVDLRRGSHRLDEQPLDPACDCEACTLYSRSFVHHLVRSSEPLGWQLLAFHNLQFYTRMMRDIRAAIRANTFASYYARQRIALAASDELGQPIRVPVAKPRQTVTTRGVFTIKTHTTGFASIAHVPSGEVMHSVNAPDDEAHALYVAQSGLIAEALTGGRPLVVWDVGLGAAHNAMALIRALDARPGHAPVELVSFERDLDAFRLALANTGPFAHLRHPGPHVLAHRARFERDGLAWTLVEGDVADTFASQPAPDVIFYDPFSSKVDGPLWSLAMFRRLHAHLVRPAELFTYSASTAVRSSLLAAGFRVARGVPSGPKEETTIALAGDHPAFARHALLDHTWLARRARSTRRWAADVPHEHHAALEQAIAEHPQFARHSGSPPHHAS